MTIDELLTGRSLTAKQTMAMRTAHGEDPAGFERVLLKTATASSPTAALVACIQRGEHRSTRMKERISKREKITTIDGAVTFALALYRSRISAYPDAERELHEIYAVDCAITACQARFDSLAIEQGLRRRLTETQLRVVS